MDNLAKIIEQLNFLYSIQTSDSLDTLELRNKGLTSVPEYVWKKKNLTSLSLVGNNLSELSEEISELSKLTELWLGGNALSSLPKQIGALYQLESLGLESNNLVDLPKSFGSLIYLEYLDLSKNKFARFPSEIRNLDNLKYLDISLNHVSIIPDFLTNLPDLQWIKLDGNPITDLSVLAKVKNLCYAEFHGMALTRRYFTRVDDWKHEWIMEEKDLELRQGLIAYFARSLKSEIRKLTAIDSWQGHHMESVFPNDLSDIINTDSKAPLSKRQSQTIDLNLRKPLIEESRGDPD